MRKILLTIFFPSLLLAQTVIYRSVQPGNTNRIADNENGTRTITVSNDTLYVRPPVADSVGIGVVVVIDSNNDGTRDRLLFIHKRIDNGTFIVKDSLGASPSFSVSNDDSSYFAHAYINLFNWEAGTENTGITLALRNFDPGNRNISTANEQWNIACYKGADATAVSISGWTTGSTQYIKIYTPVSASEVGTSQRNSTTVYNTTAGYAIAVVGVPIGIAGNANHVRIEGLQISGSGTTASGISGNGVGTVDTRISYCIIKGPGGSLTGTHIGINCGAGAGTIKIWNNIIYDWTASAAGNSCGIFGSGAGTTYAYNNTLIDNEDGIQRSVSTVIPKNNLASNNVLTDYTGTFSSAEYNASSDATAPGTNSRVSQTFSFVDYAGDNFALTTSDTAAADRGTDLSADVNLAITDDIIATARPQDSPAVAGSAYDMGAFELVSESSRNRVIMIMSIFSPIQAAIVILLIIIATPIVLPIILLLEKFGIIEKER